MAEILEIMPDAAEFERVLALGASGTLRQRKRDREHPPTVAVVGKRKPCHGSSSSASLARGKLVYSSRAPG